MGCLINSCQCHSHPPVPHGWGTDMYIKMCCWWLCCWHMIPDVGIVQKTLTHMEQWLWGWCHCRATISPMHGNSQHCVPHIFFLSSIFWTVKGAFTLVFACANPFCFIRNVNWHHPVSEQSEWTKKKSTMNWVFDAMKSCIWEMLCKKVGKNSQCIMKALTLHGMETALLMA